MRKCFPNFRRLNQQRNWKLHQLDVSKEDGNRKMYTSRDARDYEYFMNDLEEDAEMRTQVNIYKDKNARDLILTNEVEADAPVIPLEEMLEELNLDEEVQGDDDAMIIEGTSEEEN